MEKGERGRVSHPMAKGIRKEGSGRRRRVVRSLTLRDLIRYRWELKRGARRLVKKRKGAVLPFPTSHRHPSDRTRWVVRCSQSNQPSDLKNLPESSAGRGRIQNPWSDWKNIPESFTGMLLEELPLPDYIIFGLVCKGWRNSQINHKLACAPYPPPLPPVPWFVLRSYEPDSKGLEEVLSPFEEKRGQKGESQSYRLPYPRVLPRSGERLSYLGNCSGWHVLTDGGDCFCLYHPISKRVIWQPPLRRLYISPYSEYFECFVSPPPYYAICVCTITELFLIREEDREWTQIAAFVTDRYPWGISYGEERFPLTKPVAFGGDLYCLLTTKHKWDLYVIYPRPSPTTQEFEMDTSQLPTSVDDDRGVIPYMVESNGQLLLVLKVSNDRFKTCKFQVFRADFSKKMWIRTESLGDRSLELSEHVVVSIRASCLRDGVRENYIYFWDWLGDPIWRMFDLSSGEWTDCPLLVPNLDDGSLFVPTLF